MTRTSLTIRSYIFRGSVPGRFGHRHDRGIKECAGAERWDGDPVALQPGCGPAGNPVPGVSGWIALPYHPVWHESPGLSTPCGVVGLGSR